MWPIFLGGLQLVAGLLGLTFNVFLLVVITFVSDTFSRLLVNYYVFMSFFAYGDSIGLEIFRVPVKNCSYIFSI